MTSLILGIALYFSIVAVSHGLEAFRDKTNAPHFPEIMAAIMWACFYYFS